MDVDAITPQLVSQTLRAWRIEQEPPPDLLALDLLQEPSPLSPAERRLRLEDLLTDLVAVELERLRAVESLPPPRLDTRDSILTAFARDFAADNPDLQAWSALYQRYLTAIPFSPEDLAAAVPIDPRHFRRHVDAGARRLAILLQRRELEVHDRDAAIRRRRHLPPSDYAELFGTAAQQAEVAALLRQPNGPPFVSIEGLGGIGKTALARAVAFDLADQSDYDAIAWISARQSWLTDRGTIETEPDAARSLADVVGRLAAQLGQDTLAGLSVEEKLARLAIHMAASRTLVVIDNLESVTDLDVLLPALAPLANPTRFLLTSRQALSAYPLVTRRPVPPLSPEDSAALLASELRRHGYREALNSSDANRLYDLLGGMPLALKLVAAQLSRWPLDALVADMRQARRRAPEGLYTFIYRRAWMALDDHAREMLLSLLTISPDGEDLDWMRLASGLSPDPFDESLAQLLDYSLLERAGLPASPRYRLHRLTATFLQTEILAGWAAGAPPERA